MDNNTVIAIGILALIIIVVAFTFRKRLKAIIKGPLGTQLSVDATNPQPIPGATVEDAKSRRGAVRAEDLTGRGASVRRSEAEKDIVATSRKQEESSDPKA